MLEGDNLSFLEKKTPTDMTAPRRHLLSEGLQGSNTKVMVRVTSLGTLKMKCSSQDACWLSHSRFTGRL